MEELKQQSQQGERCVGGDFNAVCKLNEIRGRSNQYDSSELKGFMEFIEAMDLIDLLALGRKFIWFKLDDVSMSRLDRILITKGLIDKWKVSAQQT